MRPSGPDGWGEYGEIPPSRPKDGEVAQTPHPSFAASEETPPFTVDFTRTSSQVLRDILATARLSVHDVRGRRRRRRQSHSVSRRPREQMLPRGQP